MRNWLFLPIIVVLGILQVTILDYFGIFGVKPDLLLISVVILSLFSLRLKWILFLSIFVGILKDLLGVNAFGINTLLLPLWSFLIIKLSKKITIDNNFIFATVVFIITVFNDIITTLIFLFLGNLVQWGIFLRITFLGSLYTAFVSPLIFKFIKQVILKEK